MTALLAPNSSTGQNHHRKPTAAGLGNQATADDLSDQLSSMGAPETLALFSRFLGALHLVSQQSELSGACALIVEQSCRVLRCATAAIFLVATDDDSGDLQLNASRGVPPRKDIRLPRGKGLVGVVATTGQTLLIADAHADPRFDSSHDRVNKFRTQSVLACPVRDAQGEIVGVLQCINKRPATAGDEPLRNDGTDEVEEFGPVEVRQHCDSTKRTQELAA